MSGPDAAGAGRQRVPAGLLGKLMAAVRPEFRADDLVFDPSDPVFGGPPCAVGGCDRPRRNRGLCTSHWHRWRSAGRPDLAGFAATAGPGWHGHLPLNPCTVTGCNYGAASRGLCNRHAKQWRRAGRPDQAAWLASTAPVPPGRPPAACRIGYCGLWAQGTSVFCHIHRDRWTRSGRPDADEFAASCENPGPGQEHIDLRRLPAGLRLEIQYVLQCRSDEQDTRLPPEDVRPFAAVLAAAGVSSLLDQPEEWWTARPSRGSRHGWRSFVLDARRRVEALASGAGWETGYPRDTWRLRALGIARGDAAIRFTGIPQPWLKDLAKRYARWQLSTGLTAATARSGALGVTRFAAWLASLPAPPAGLDGVDRPLLERYLAVLHAEMGGQQRHQQYVSALSGFLRAIRQHGWDGTMPATAVIFPEDFPARGERLPRGLADHVMAQVEQPASLDRWDTPAYRIITVILIRCGLRISSAAGIASDCTVTTPTALLTCATTTPR